MNSASATENATTHWPHRERTVVLGSVIIKKTNNWYIGPVIGATSANHGWPVIQLLRNANKKKEIT